ncbi:hypothetical protein [Murimonas intestini]|uniref:hypothetical protein n=1 Tax=Murimonas intestini TaxID=1337051 RepID=UPI0011DC9700|nr:hypothetical protein [Murimonas intestini]
MSFDFEGYTPNDLYTVPQIYMPQDIYGPQEMYVPQELYIPRDLYAPQNLEYTERTLENEEWNELSIPGYPFTDEIPDLEPAVLSDDLFVTGNPQEVSVRLDYMQGDNPFNAYGNCGLVSVSNLLQLAGIDLGEDDITLFALKNNMCEYIDGDPENSGGTYPDNLVDILKCAGIDAQYQLTWSDMSGITSYEGIADLVESGNGVIMQVNAGYLWDSPQAMSVDENGSALVNHWVTVTGVARDAQTGEIQGFYICDSGRGMETDSCRLVTTDILDDAYMNAQGSSIVYTTSPIRIV